MMKNPPHTVALKLVRRALERELPEGWDVRTQDPITLATSEPAPDLAVVRGQFLDYLQRHPGPKDAALVVEVADATLHRDQTTKKWIYAEAGIPVYWIANLPESRVELYSRPSGPAQRPDYQERCDCGLSEEIPLLLEGQQIAVIPVRSLLPHEAD
jgi:Uma2 family endonuclease